MTSLFAIPAKEFPHDDASQNLSYDTQWLVRRMCRCLPCPPARAQLPGVVRANNNLSLVAGELVSLAAVGMLVWYLREFVGPRAEQSPSALTEKLLDTYERVRYEGLGTWRRSRRQREMTEDLEGF